MTEVEHHQTLTDTRFRHRKYRDDRSRLRLRRRILNELINKEQLDSDDCISLGEGGAKPHNPKYECQAYIVSGPPASGKSTIASRLASLNGAYMLDSDYAKRKFPEYNSFSAGASLVHGEADSIVFAPQDSLLEYCLYKSVNVVIPLVGKTFDSVESICRKLVEANYNLHIINVTLDRWKCTYRAYKRFEETKRYVPLSYVFDEVGHEPERIYFQLKRAHCHDAHFVSFSQVSNDVNKGDPSRVIETTCSC